MTVLPSECVCFRQVPQQFWLKMRATVLEHWPHKVRVWFQVSPFQPNSLTFLFFWNHLHLSRTFLVLKTLLYCPLLDGCFFFFFGACLLRTSLYFQGDSIALEEDDLFWKREKALYFVFLFCSVFAKKKKIYSPEIKFGHCKSVWFEGLVINVFFGVKLWGFCL